MKKERLQYESPLARDLSAFVRGQEPLNCRHGNNAIISGVCEVGGTAFGSCGVGFTPGSGQPALDCANGSFPGPTQCGTGQNPT